MKKIMSLNSTEDVSNIDSNLQNAIALKTEASEKVLALRKRVIFGLIAPEDEKFISGTIKDQELMQEKVFYQFNVNGTSETAEAEIDENGHISLNTERVVLATEHSIIKIITMVCTHVECIASYLEVHLYPPTGYIKSRIGKVNAQYGEKATLEISDLYTFEHKQDDKSKSDL